jgi:RNA polymerase sigma-70 factor (ECF subfamily)
MRDKRQIADFDKLFYDNYERLYILSMAILGEKETCRDVLSDTFELLWLNMEKLNKDNINAYLYTMVKTRSINILKHNKVKREYANHILYSSNTYCISENEFMENELKTKLLNDAINTLSSPANEIFKARLIDGLKYKEIANRLDISLSLVKKHMLRSTVAVHEYIRKYHE